MPDSDFPEGSLNQLSPGTYHVVPVVCMARECVNWDMCHDGTGCCNRGSCGEVGLQDKDAGVYMICRNYWFPLSLKECDKKVFWARVVPR